MAPSRSRAQRTQEELDDQDRERWDQLFAEEEARHRALSRIDLQANQGESDDDLASPSPVYDRCLRVYGADHVLRMCNFAPMEFERLWDALEDHILSHWNVGRGKKSSNDPKDILFMLLASLKHCGSWDTVSNLFHIDPSPFQKMIKKFTTMLEPFVYQTFVEDEEKRWTMKQLTATGNTFANFPCARYATDVTFQQADTPSGRVNEIKKYFSGKHHLYGLKVEVSVIPTGVAVNCSSWEPGSVHDSTIFRSNKMFHISAMQKKFDETLLDDEGPLLDQYEHDWAVLVDKEYQGLVDEFRIIQPKIKAPHEPPLSAEDRREIDRISQDRVLVENYFGRLKKMWGVMAHKWTRDRPSYNMFFRTCLAFTNYSVRCRPLRREEGVYFQRYEARLIDVGLATEESKKLKRQKYRDDRRARLQLHSRGVVRTRTSSSRRTSVGNVGLDSDSRHRTTSNRRASVGSSSLLDSDYSIEFGLS
ncbi:hypothetical protein ON010_g904 [Phytophthora cinnamomi]|nr:hypothetical protein ON010_g904 [Phytophthora cinnamomi]